MSQVAVDYEGEPLTAGGFVRKLLEHVVEHTWIEFTRNRCGRGCCGTERYTACSYCGAEEGNYGSDDYQKHKPVCKLAALTNQAEAFLRVEDGFA